MWDKANEYLTKRSQIKRREKPDAVRDFHGKYCM